VLVVLAVIAVRVEFLRRFRTRTVEGVAQRRKDVTLAAEIVIDIIRDPTVEKGT
jgi:hypothetical protein